MRLKFALLAAVGAIVALAAPTGSMAAFTPTNANFEIKGDSQGPKITTSLGSCSLTRISGTTPSAETINVAFLAAPTPGACTVGASVTTTGTWYMEALSSFDVRIWGGLTLKYASLPGCKLAGVPILAGAWFNGLTTASVYHPESTGTMAWANDGGTCAIAGQNETVRFDDTKVNGTINVSAFTTVNNLTSPSAPIRIK